ncbi:cyclic nucleotide-binding domain-containing protein [Sulfuriflexus sp.]|uniref:Crp/Fnr family transcriptional regulator n=1 Tax=Sulfuriflexus sp. TaxID=2015443 RepID=UPI0028CD43A6|nr:cyclic nucleotide-binding domain-containing protein [Sulfuriflexus sp.]MDT8403893.1 cyclic nucleotide-binding domain-containing protein [Sulfuriflexus sp.]
MSDGLKNLEQQAVDDARLCQMLENISLLQGFERAEIEKLAQYCRAYKATNGTVIFKEGEKSHFMCLLVAGRVNILKENKQVATIRAGKSMGEMSLIDGFPYSATAISAVDSELVMFTRLQFERLGETNPLVALKLYKAIARLMSLRLRQTTGVLIDYLQDPA